MTTVPYPAAVAMHFTDGDIVRSTSGALWVRGLRHAGQWANPSDRQATHCDDAVRSLLVSCDATFSPKLPHAHQALPGTNCASREALQALVLRPATGAVLYTASLNGTQSFLGNDFGVMRSNTPLTLASVRASLTSTLLRHPCASLTYHRATGRLFARYAIAGARLHTHVYVLTTG